MAHAKCLVFHEPHRAGRAIEYDSMTEANPSNIPAGLSCMVCVLPLGTASSRIFAYKDRFFYHLDCRPCGVCHIPPKAPRTIRPQINMYEKSPGVVFDCTECIIPIPMRVAQFRQMLGQGMMPLISLLYWAPLDEVRAFLQMYHPVMTQDFMTPLRIAWYHRIGKDPSVPELDDIIQ